MAMFFMMLVMYQMKELASSLKSNLEKGIHGDEGDLMNRREAFGSNTYPRKKGRSFLVYFLQSKFFLWPELLNKVL